MFFNCDCGTQVHLYTKIDKQEQPINLLCFKCYKEKNVRLYEIEYETPPIRAIFQAKVFAETKELARMILQEYKGECTIRKVKEVIG